MGCFLSKLFQMKAEQICVSPKISEKTAAFVVFKLRFEALTMSDLNNIVGKNGRSSQARVVRQPSV